MIDDSVVERVATAAPGSLMHHNHTAKPNRPKFLRGQGWRCLAAVIERNDFAVGAVPLLLRLVRRGTNRGKLRSAGLLLRLLGQRLGHVRRLLDACPVEHRAGSRRLRLGIGDPRPRLRMRELREARELTAAPMSDWRDDVFAVLKRAEIRQVGYVPDAGHARLIELSRDDPDIRAVPLTSESGA